MRTLLVLAVLFLAPAAHGQTLEDLHWLKGCWRTSGPGPAITEVWLAPPMPAMIGYSYTERDGQTRAWEAMRIELSDGHPVFVAMPNGAAPVRFTAHAGYGENFVRFDNPQHDYPQSIRYRREGDRLTATIARTDGGDETRFEYRRIACPANLRP